MPCTTACHAWINALHHGVSRHVAGPATSAACLGSAWLAAVSRLRLLSRRCHPRAAPSCLLRSPALGSCRG